MEQDSNSPSVGTTSPVSKSQTQSHPSGSNMNTVPTSLPSKRTSKTTSDVWDHFDKYKDANNNSRATCKYCDKDYAGGTRLQGTSTLRNHLITQCPKYPYRLEDKKQKTLCFKKTTTIGSESSGVMISRVKDCLSKLVSHYSNEQRLKNPENNNPQTKVSNEDSVKTVDSDDDSDMFESEFDKECDEDDALDTRNELDSLSGNPSARECNTFLLGVKNYNLCSTF
ncbi:hypothetical protein POM88_008656 [Heracleum sosnowskyi]|uniref:BED-type domain-containing protein n=1 Tax=Heracleum sosnowskyi TaxID=360622 RepID=A0AAD8N8S6_9APIA|nr:hypothetical protein POM88_008656 [Heracleum sosnowskyi]